MVAHVEYPFGGLGAVGGAAPLESGGLKIVMVPLSWIMTGGGVPPPRKNGFCKTIAKS